MTQSGTLGRALVIFGATGDLAQRMLLPSLYFLEAEGFLPKELVVIGCSRAAISASRARRICCLALPFTAGC